MLSIITPVLNGEKFIEGNISAISQLKIPFEHIIVDGGSSDGTVGIVSLYPHVKLIFQNDKNGMYSAVNQGINLSKGEFVTYINCDDIIDPVNFAIMYNTIDDSEWDFIYSDGYLMDSDSGRSKFYKSAKYLFRYFLRNGIMPFNQPCSIYSRNLFNTIGGFDSENFRWCGDIDFFRKVISMKDIKIKYLNLPTVTFLVHSKSLTSINYDSFDEEYARTSIPVPTLFIRGVFFLSRLFRL